MSNENKQPLRWQAFVNDPSAAGALQRIAAQSRAGQVVRGDIHTAVHALKAFDDFAPLLLIELNSHDSVVDDIQTLADVCVENTHVIALGKQYNTEMQERLLSLGVDSYLELPLTQEKLSEAMESVGVMIGEPSKHQTIAVVGARGGLGSSIFSQNLAWMLGHTYAAQTCLIDGDLYLGTTTFSLDQKPNHGLMTALEQSPTLGLSQLQNLTQVYDQYLVTLTADLPLDYPSSVTHVPSALTKVLQLITGHYGATVIDTGKLCHSGDIHHEWLPILQNSDHFIVLTPLCYLGLRDAERITQYLKSVKPTTNVIVATIDWHPFYPADISSAEFSKRLQATVLELPMIKAGNGIRFTSKPLVEHAPNHPYSKMLSDLVQQFDVTTPKTHSTSLWRKLWGI